MPVTVKVEAASSTVESTEAEEAKAESEEREEAETEAESTGAASGSSIYFFFLRILQLVEQGNEPSDCTESEYRAMFSEEVGEVVS